MKLLVSCILAGSEGEWRIAKDISEVIDFTKVSPTLNRAFVRIKPVEIEK